MLRSEGRFLDRRRFLRALGAGTAACALSHRALASALAEGPKGGVVLGAGAHRYEWVRGWGTLPAGVTLGTMHGGVAVDTQQNVYVSTDNDASIIVFDPQGRFVRSIGREWKPDKEGDGTHDLQVHREGGQDFLYLVSLFRHEFAKLTTSGEVVWVKGFPEASGVYKAKEEFRPTGIAVCRSGEFYVADGYGANYVHRYSAKGEYLSSWGGKCTEAREAGRFSTPHKIVVDERGRVPTVLVGDRGNHRLQWFTLDGKHVKTVDGTDHDFLRLPAALSIRGSEVAIGDLKGRLTILDGKDRLAAQLGDSGDEKKQGTNKLAPDQWVDGQFIAPHGVSWDAKGDLYVSEWSLAGRIVKLKKVG